MKKDKKVSNKLIKRLLEKMRPKKRSDCRNIPRPCIYISCKYNIFADINPTSGKLKILFPECEDPTDMECETNCVLDIVEKNGSMTLEDIGKELNITRERVRQLQDAAMRKMRPTTHDQRIT